MIESNKVMIRSVEADQIDELVDMIHELAAYEKFNPLEKSLLKDNLLNYGYGANPKFRADFAVIAEEKVGYIFYSFPFSATQGKPVLYLEDIYVRESHRQNKVATLLFKRLAQVAHKEDCCRIEWGVLKWNTAAQIFYQSIGATLLDRSLRGILNPEQIEALL